MKRQSQVTETVKTTLATMAEAGIELFTANDVADWSGLDMNSTLSANLAQLAKEHAIVLTRYSELNGNRGKVFSFNESTVNANMHRGAR